MSILYTFINNTHTHTQKQDTYEIIIVKMFIFWLKYEL